MDGEIISAPIKLCCNCRNPGEYQRQNSSYNNDGLNWLVICERCRPMNDEFWKEQWDDYYRGRM